MQSDSSKSLPPDNQPTSPRWRSEYPFASRFMELDGHRIHYIDENATGENSTAEDSSGETADSSETILMVHGNPTWSFYWRNLIARLRHDRRVVAIDHLGCGLSDKPADYDYCLQRHIDNLCGLIDRLDLQRVTLMAHDWGGAIGLGALLARRSRFNRIVLFNTAAFPPPFIPFRIRVCRWPLVGKIGVQGFNLFARAAVRMATEQPGGLPPHVAEGMLFPYDSWDHRVAIYRFVKDIPLTPAHRTWSVLESIESGLRDVADWPILMIWGMKDWCFRPECLRRMQSHWPSATVHEIADAGHYIVEDAAEDAVRYVTEFLSDDV